MGGCLSGSDDESYNGADEQMRAVQRQRRRLSVTPHQVGDVLGNHGENKDRRESALQSVDRSVNNTNTFSSHNTEAGALGLLDYVAVTKKGYVPYNRGKINQDSFVANPDMGHGVSMWGVLDGHGDAGALVSEYIAKALDEFGRQFLEKAGDGEINGEEMLAEIIKRSVHRMDTESKIDTTFSGTTLVVSVLVGKKLWTANIGDSRAILVQKKGERITGVKALSRDHKPELPDEAARILACGGRVAKLPGPATVDMGPLRVWLADMDVPGLAMSRSIGDGIAHRAGVTTDPEITLHELDGVDDWICIWASDGVWEFLENEDVAGIIHTGLEGKEGRLDTSAQELVNKAVQKWCAEEDAIDDITAVCVVMRSAAEPENPEKPKAVEPAAAEPQTVEGTKHIESGIQALSPEEV